MINDAHINFQELTGSMRVRENNQIVYYYIGLSNDKKVGLVTENRFESIDDRYIHVGSKSEQMTLAEIKQDTTKTVLFKWFATGVFGIPE